MEAIKDIRIISLKIL